MPLAQAGVQTHPSLGGSEVVLLVDDERGVRTVASQMLKSFGYTVLEEHGAEDAVRAAAAHPGPIHLLLTDVSLCGECGRALAAVLMATHPRLKVLFMSGLTKAAVASAAREPANFLPKPFSAAELAAKVRQVLDAA
jgi:two-component system cell cycle sensor histidine kinase/response regulator CckA